MTPRERLAAHLLNVYWTGAGDAGTESAILNFRDVIEETTHPLSDALENGKSTTLYRTNGYTVSMTDHFLMLAEKILDDLVEEKYREARVQIKAGIKQSVVDMMHFRGASESQIKIIEDSFGTPAADALLAMLVQTSPKLSGDLRAAKLAEGWFSAIKK